MKYLILIATLVSTPIFAGDPSVDPALEEMRGAARSVGDEYTTLGGSLCTSYNLDTDTAEQMKATIRVTMAAQVNGNSNPSKCEMVEFLNTHKDKLTCWGKHYLAKAFDEGVYMSVYTDLFKKDLYSKNECQIDYNSITMTYNPATKTKEPMTILDYIENVVLHDRAILISTTATRNVRYIKNMIIKKFGAKNFRELPEAEQQPFLK